MGRGDADAVRMIVVTWLIEKGFAAEAIKNKVRQGRMHRRTADG